MTTEQDPTLNIDESPIVWDAQDAKLTGAIGDRYINHRNAPQGATLRYGTLDGGSPPRREGAYAWQVVPPSPPRFDWSKFDAPANEGPFAKNLREARKLLALRVSRNAPQPMIDLARLGLDNITADIKAIHAQQTAPEASPAGILSNMSPTVRNTMLASVAALYVVALLGISQPKPHVEALFPAKPVTHPGIGYALMQGNSFVPDDPKASAQQQAYAAKILKQSNAAYAKFQRSK